MPEDTEQVVETTEASTEAESQGYADVLNDEGTPSPESPSGVKPEEVSSKEQPKEEAPSEEDPEITVEIGGKTFTGKQSEILANLENVTKLAEKEKNLLKDYTQKTQAIAAQRKSFEEAFGEIPSPENLKSLGKLYQAYFSDPKAAEIIDAVLAGDVDSLLQGGAQETATGTKNPETTALKQQIAALEGKLSEFQESIQSQAEKQARGESKKTWDSWVSKRQGAEQGFQITEDIDQAMSPFITALSKQHPDWDDHKILDAAYRHATIDQQPAKIASKILVSADKAKNNPPKITPKGAQKPESEKGYAELLEA